MQGRELMTERHGCKMNVETHSAVFRRFALIVVLGALLTGCAAAGGSDPQANDPWEGSNRAVFAVNEALDENIGQPVARAYGDAVPPFVRDRIRDFVTNFGEPVNFINAVLQGNQERAAETFVRFIVNSTAGMGGFFDVAAQYGQPENEEDFGQTLAVWGVEPGPYVMLPIFGPSSVRGTVGKIVDNFSNPISYFMPTFGNITKSVAGGIDKRQRNLETLDDLKKNSLDYYAALRSLYRQNRRDQINNGQVKGPVLDIPVYAN